MCRLCSKEELSSFLAKLLTPRTCILITGCGMSQLGEKIYDQCDARTPAHRGVPPMPAQLRPVHVPPLTLAVPPCSPRNECRDITCLDWSDDVVKYKAKKNS